MNINGSTNENPNFCSTMYKTIDFSNYDFNLKNKKNQKILNNVGLASLANTREYLDSKLNLNLNLNLANKGYSTNISINPGKSTKNYPNEFVNHISLLKLKTFPINNVNAQIQHYEMNQKIFPINQHYQANKITDKPNQATTTTNFIHRNDSALSRPLTPPKVSNLPQWDGVIDNFSSFKVQKENVKNLAETEIKTSLTNNSNLFSLKISPQIPATINSAAISAEQNIQNTTSNVSILNDLVRPDVKLNSESNQKKIESSQIILNKKSPSLNSNSKFQNCSNQVFSNANISQSTSLGNKNLTLICNKSHMINQSFPVNLLNYSYSISQQNSPSAASKYIPGSQILDKDIKSFLLNSSTLNPQSLPYFISNLNDTQKTTSLKSSTNKFNCNKTIPNNSSNIINQSEKGFKAISNKNPIPLKNESPNKLLQKKKEALNFSLKSPVKTILKSKYLHKNNRLYQKLKANAAEKATEIQECYESVSEGNKISSIYSSLKFKNKANNINKLNDTNEKSINLNKRNYEEYVLTSFGNEEKNQPINDYVHSKGNISPNKKLEQTKKLIQTNSNSSENINVIKDEKIQKPDVTINKIEDSPEDERIKNIIKIYATTINTTPSQLNNSFNTAQIEDDNSYSNYENQKNSNSKCNPIILNNLFEVKNNETKEEDLPVFGKKMKDAQSFKSNVINQRENRIEQNNLSSLQIENELQVKLKLKSIQNLFKNENENSLIISKEEIKNSQKILSQDRSFHDDEYKINNNVNNNAFNSKEYGQNLKLLEAHNIKPGIINSDEICCKSQIDKKYSIQLNDKFFSNNSMLFTSNKFKNCLPQNDMSSATSENNNTNNRICENFLKCNKKNLNESILFEQNSGIPFYKNNDISYSQLSVSVSNSNLSQKNIMNHQEIIVPSINSITNENCFKLIPSQMKKSLGPSKLPINLPENKKNEYQMCNLNSNAQYQFNSIRFPQSSPVQEYII